MFFGGWGDAKTLVSIENGVSRMAGADAVTVQWETPRRRSGVEVIDGRFLSPRVDLVLPDESLTAHVRWWKGGGERLLVVMAGSGEQGYFVREQVWAPLSRAGVDVMLLENPYYGVRRPKSQSGTVLETVLDQVKMTAASVAEASGLLQWGKASGYRSVALAGYSMGGYMASVTAAVTPLDVGLVALASGVSARQTFTETLYARCIDFDALGHDRVRLGALVDRGSVRHLPMPARTDAAILVGCTRDGFVPNDDTQALADLWPRAELRWVKAGHVSVILSARRALRQAALDSFARLETGTATSS